MSAYRFFRPLLWTLDAERAHDMAMASLTRAGRSPWVRRRLQRTYVRDAPTLATEVWGLSFPNCVGLAAGMDKDGRALPAMAALGFGFLEVGTVTPRPQGGNPKPRMWRLPEHRALVNRLGFNNDGASALASRLAADGPLLNVPLGINIGKNADTPLDEAFTDYQKCLNILHPWADYVVVNISSPNTPGLRSLQHAAALNDLLGAMRREIDSLPAGHKRKEVATDVADAPAARTPRPLPLLVKVAPDLTSADLDDIADACIRHRIDGIVATNTTVRRDGVTGPHTDEAGGLSGAPLTDMSNRIVAALHRRVGKRIPIIGVGGIMNADDAYAKIKAGASLVQVLTGFVYGGPRFPSRLAAGLHGLLLQDGLSHVGGAVGVDAERYAEPETAPSAPTPVR